MGLVVRTCSVRRGSRRTSAGRRGPWPGRPRPCRTSARRLPGRSRRRLGILPGFGHPDVLQAPLGFLLQTLGQLVQGLPVLWSSVARGRLGRLGGAPSRSRARRRRAASCGPISRPRRDRAELRARTLIAGIMAPREQLLFLHAAMAPREALDERSASRSRRSPRLGRRWKCPSDTAMAKGLPGSWRGADSAAGSPTWRRPPGPAHGVGARSPGRSRSG